MGKKELKKSRRCMVCGKEVPEGEWISINASVTEKSRIIWGHPTCMDNVNRLVVIPNRFKVYDLLIDWKGKIAQSLTTYNKWAPAKSGLTSLV
jgi:hypothetical protein